jgi:hypothetical protein
MRLAEYTTVEYSDSTYTGILAPDPVLMTPGMTVYSAWTAMSGASAFDVLFQWTGSAHPAVLDSVTYSVEFSDDAATIIGGAYVATALCLTAGSSQWSPVSASVLVPYRFEYPLACPFGYVRVAALNTDGVESVIDATCSIRRVTDTRGSVSVERGRADLFFSEAPRQFTVANANRACAVMLIFSTDESTSPIVTCDNYGKISGDPCNYSLASITTAAGSTTNLDMTEVVDGYPYNTAALSLRVPYTSERDERIAVPFDEIDHYIDLGGYTIQLESIVFRVR